MELVSEIEASKDVECGKFEANFVLLRRRAALLAESNARLAFVGVVHAGICLEKTVVMGRKFGLLQNCDHPFCLECIRKLASRSRKLQAFFSWIRSKRRFLLTSGQWRGNTDDFGTAVRHCPLCRVSSYVVIPR